jgi:putative SOS response-associated peptidase YedK
MCGRFVGFRKIEELIAAFPIDQTETTVTASYNIAPTQKVLAIVHDQGKNRLKRLHWGLVPFWAKDTTIGQRLINARSETVASKPSFRHAFKHRRCLIPADGFYEWQGEKGKKQPVYFTLPDDRPFAFAGLWERWDDHGKADAAYLSCAILTTAASSSVKPVHHRMPVILDPHAYVAWLDADNQDVNALGAILHTGIIAELTYRPVSPRVNAARNNSPDNIKPMIQMSIDFK